MGGAVSGDGKELGEECGKEEVDEQEEGGEEEENKEVEEGAGKVQVLEKDRHWWRELGGEEAGLDEGRHEEEEELKDGEGGEDERGQGAL